MAVQEGQQTITKLQASIPPASRAHLQTHLLMIFCVPCDSQKYQVPHAVCTIPVSAWPKASRPILMSIYLTYNELNTATYHVCTQQHWLQVTTCHAPKEVQIHKSRHIAVMTLSILIVIWEQSAAYVAAWNSLHAFVLFWAPVWIGIAWTQRPTNRAWWCGLLQSWTSGSSACVLTSSWTTWKNVKTIQIRINVGCPSQIMHTLAPLAPGQSQTMTSDLY